MPTGNAMCLGVTGCDFTVVRYWRICCHHESQFLSILSKQDSCEKDELRLLQLLLKGERFSVLLWGRMGCKT